MKSCIYELRISSVDESFKLTPNNLSALALSQYIESLVNLLGGKKHKNSFIFEGLTEGSANLALKSDQSYEDIVNKTPQLDKINEILASNGHRAELKKDGNILYLFDGKKEESIIELYQEASFYGQVIKIGGKDNTIPLSLEDSEKNIINLTIKDRTLAKEISRYYLGEEIECHGEGFIKKDKNNKWSPVPNKFFITKFEVLQHSSASQWLEELDDLSPNWKKTESPMELCKELRGKDN